jgi:tryptophan synthase beta chain
VLNHVLLHQTVIGQEAKKQLAMFGEKQPDVVIACAGGGSNFAGLAFPFVSDKLNGAKIDIIPVEPASCPSMTKAPFVYDHGDLAKMTPLLAMHSLGHDFVPPPIHAGGLRYHGMAPLVSAAIVEGLVTPRALHQLECYNAAVQFAQTEGIIPAPETSHAIAVAIQEAKKAKEEGKEKVILFNMSGHGLMDLRGFELFFQGKLQDYALPEEEIHKALERIKHHPKPAVLASGRKY